MVDPLTVRFITNGAVPLMATNLSNVFMMSGAKGLQPTGDFNTAKASIGTPH